MICRFFQENDLIACGILILQGFLTFQEYQFGNNPYFARIPYAATVFFL